MEKSEGAVRVTIHRALKALKKEVNGLKDKDVPATAKGPIIES